MPYPNIHSCRVRDPKLFKQDSFKTLKTNQKGASIVIARLKSNNELTVQSYRYSKQHWAIDNVKKHCSAHDGKCEGASTRKQLCLADDDKDYLLVDEITKEIVSGIRLDFLYRTHTRLHNQADKQNIEAVKSAHKIIADELLTRGFLHQSWDAIDSDYQKSVKT